MLPGLIIHNNYITEEVEQELLDNINVGEWGRSLKRRVQQFGPIYNYTNRKLVKAEMEIPSWLSDRCFLKMMVYFEDEPNQVIVNEYESGQGISKHIDADVFGPTIASLSLMSDTDMVLGQYRGEEKTIKIERRSLLVLSGEARFNWYHYIPKVTEKRVSITFRTTVD